MKDAEKFLLLFFVFMLILDKPFVGSAYTEIFLFFYVDKPMVNIDKNG